jgi:hypothetical protein
MEAAAKSKAVDTEKRIPKSSQFWLITEDDDARRRAQRKRKFGPTWCYAAECGVPIRLDHILSASHRRCPLVSQTVGNESTAMTGPNTAQESPGTPFRDRGAGASSRCNAGDVFRFASDTIS